MELETLAAGRGRGLGEKEQRRHGAGRRRRLGQECQASRGGARRLPLLPGVPRPPAPVSPGPSARRAAAGAAARAAARAARAAAAPSSPFPGRCLRPAVLGSRGSGVGLRVSGRMGAGGAAPRRNAGRRSLELLGHAGFLLLQGKTRRQSRRHACSRFKSSCQPSGKL